MSLDENDVADAVHGQLARMIGNYIPHVQEHNGHIPDSFSFQYDCRIFPVTKTTLLINIFISKVNSAGESCFTINNTDFTMITIILNDIHEADEMD